MLASGKVFKYGDNIDTDVIIPARYLNTPNMKELASHCMEDIDKEFAQKVEEGDIIVANKNFGCGSSREHAPIAIKESGISEGNNLFLINKDYAVQNIKEKLPYIGEVTISRKLPGTVSISVSDATIAGAVSYNGGYLIIDGNGKAVEQLTEYPTEYPEIVGLNISDAVIGTEIVYADNDQKIAFTELLNAIEQSGLDKITKIDISDTYSIKAVYDGRITMNFGMATDLTYKARFAKSIFDSGKIQSTEKGTLDLSVVTDNNKVYFSPDYSVTSSSEAA